MQKGLSAVIFGSTGAVGKVIHLKHRQFSVVFWSQKSGPKCTVLSGKNLKNGLSYIIRKSLLFKWNPI